MKYIHLFLALLISFQSCRGQNDHSEEMVEINGVKISSDFLLELKKATGKEPVEFIKVNYYYEKSDTTWIETTDTIHNGFYFSKIAEKKAKEIAQKYSEKCILSGNYIFLKELDFDKNWHPIYDITVVKAKDQFEVLKIMNTQGVNYDVTNDMVIENIKAWNTLVGLRILVAQEDRVEAYLEKLPDNLEEFTNQIYELCPDVIEQGYGDMDEMISDYKTNKYIWMWWD